MIDEAGRIERESNGYFVAYSAFGFWQALGFGCCCVVDR